MRRRPAGLALQVAVTDVMARIGAIRHDRLGHTALQQKMLCKLHDLLNIIMELRWAAFRPPRLKPKVMKVVCNIG